jgi:hypothetical protein
VAGIHPVAYPRTDFDKLLPAVKEQFGREIWAYQEFFARAPDAAEVIEKNVS